MGRKQLLKDYVSPKAEDNVRNYKYKCTTDSLVYTYLLGPLANYSLKFTPPTVSPNTLTFLGFICNLIPFLMIQFTNADDMSVNIPRWLCIFGGFSQFVYMNFDNMDGKQARKTGSSSPLGMLYDHGLDSMNGWLMGMNLASCLRIGNGTLTYTIMVLAPMLGFFFTIWEEYKLDILNFGYINPVDEGLTGLNLMMIFSGIVGCDWWLEDGVLGFKRNEVAAFSVCLVTVLGIIRNVYNVITKSKGALEYKLNKLKVPLFLVVCATLINVFSPTDIVGRRTPSMIIFFGLGYSKVIGHLQLAHCSGEEFQQWRRSFVMSSLMVVGNTVCGYLLGKCPVNEDLLLNAGIVFNLLCLIHYFLSITQQLTRVLDVKVFSIKKAKAK